MKYIKSYMIKESLLSDVESTLNDLETINKKIKVLNDQKELHIKKLNKEHKGHLVKVISKCLDILNKGDGFNIYDHSELILGIWDLLEEDYSIKEIEKQENEYYIILDDRTEHGEDVSLDTYDSIKLYNILKFLISIPEVSKNINKEAFVSLNN